MMFRALLGGASVACAAAAGAAWPGCYEARDCGGADFTGLSMWGSTLNDASFAGSMWGGVGMGGSQAKNANFANAAMNGVYANHVSFQNAVMTNADVSGAYFDHSTFKGADLTGAVVTTDTDFTAASFDSATTFPDGAAWRSTGFFAATMRGMRGDLSFADLSGADMRPAADPVRFASFAQWSFTRMAAAGARFAGCDFAGAAMWAVQAAGADFSHATLTGAPLHYSNLAGADFTGAVLAGTGLKHCNMDECVLQDADLRTAVMDGTTKMRGCTYNAGTLFPEGFDPAAWGMVEVGAPPAPSWPSCYEARNCDGVDFALTPDPTHNQVYSDASYVDSLWNGVGLQGSQAKNATFSGASFSSAYANHVNFEGSRLDGADLTGALLDHSTFKGADLTGAVVTTDTDFTAASFDSATTFPDGAAWRSTGFFAATMRGMRGDLSFADLSGADMRPAADPVRFASFAQWSFTRMAAAGARFAGCDFAGAAMWAVQAAGADFSHATLTGAPLHYSNLAGADFTGAVLAGTGLKHCNMEECNVSGAAMAEADFDETTKFTGCVFDDATAFPEGFDPRGAGMKHVDDTPAPPTPAPPTPVPPTPAPLFPVKPLGEVVGNTLNYTGMACFDMGINLASVEYWSTAQTFKDGFAESGGCCWPVDAEVDADGNLLAASGDPHGAEYWIAGRNLLFRVDGDYPSGEYVLRAEGSGVITLAFDVDGGSRTVPVPTGPDGYAVNVTAYPNSPGVQITVEATSAADPVRAVSFMLKEYDEEPAGASPFTPQFVASLAGMKVLRYMDLGLTNNNNVAKWADRNTKQSFSQARTIGRTAGIVGVALPPPADPATSFTKFPIEFTTATPHGLTTGQTVSVTELAGTVTVTRPGEADLVVDLAALSWPRMAEVTAAATFRVHLSEWWWTDSYVPASIAEASAGRVEVRIRPGVAYEHMLDLAKELDTDPWFCVPHLADDEYVAEMARLIATAGLGAGRTVYVELSNEVWNGLFDQQRYAEARQRELGLMYNSRYVGHRSAEIFAIFAAEFAAAPGAPQLNRVLASQSVNSWISEQVILGAGGSGAFDSLAIAPYFGAAAAAVFARGAGGNTVDGVSVADVLELCLENIFTDFVTHVQAQKGVADAHGAALVAYEGGQHLGGGGPNPVNGGWLTDEAEFQDLMIAANRDARMHNVYNEYFRLWGELGGGLFAHFSHVGKPSKYGSWGVKETHAAANTVEASPKYAAVFGVAGHCASV